MNMMVLLMSSYSLPEVPQRLREARYMFRCLPSYASGCGGEQSAISALAVFDMLGVGHPHLKRFTVHNPQNQ